MGKEVIPFLAFIRNRHIQQEDICIMECTRHYDVDELRLVLGQAWDVADITFSPVDLGVPSSRCRKYMVAIRRQGRVRWRQDLG
eukprot:2422631-Alexandrium_andersonii.AAC.1